MLHEIDPISISIRETLVLTGDSADRVQDRHRMGSGEPPAVMSRSIVEGFWFPLNIRLVTIPIGGFTGRPVGSLGQVPTTALFIILGEIYLVPQTLERFTGMGKINWRKVVDAKKIQASKEYEHQQRIKKRIQYSPYRCGNFYIGHRLVDRWHPRNQNYPGDGLFVNAQTGNFEIWVDAKMVSEIFWKQDWHILVEWAHKFGFTTGVSE